MCVYVHTLTGTVCVYVHTLTGIKRREKEVIWVTMMMRKGRMVYDMYFLDIR